MEFRKFLMDELKKVSASLQKYEDKFMESGSLPEAQLEYIKSSIAYYRDQAVELRKQIFETRGSVA